MVAVVILIMISVASVAIGSALIYAAFTGKLMSPPDPEEPFQNKFVFALRGFWGGCLILMGIVILLFIFKNA